MGYSKIVTSDVVIQRCIEVSGIHKRGNSSYNNLVGPGATSVRRPRLPQLVVKTNSGTPMSNADRKKTGEDTTMVTTDLKTYAVPISSEIANQFDTNRKLLNDFAVSASLTLARQWDRDYIYAAVHGCANVIQTKLAGAVGWNDLSAISKKFRKLEVPRADLMLVVSAEIEDLVMDIDVIKQAAAFNTLQLQSGGRLVKVGDFDVYFSGQVGKSDNGKDCIVGIYAPGIASIISSSAVMKEAWDGETLKDHIDFVSYAAFEKDGDEFSVVLEVK